MKICFKCGIRKDIEQFYRHPMMADGRLGKCKECARSDVILNRAKKIDYYRGYDLSRAMLPHRVAARKEYIQTANGRAVKAKSIRRYQEKFPLKKRAAVMVNNAVRDGRLIKDLCLVCGESKVEAHHEDYSKPLDVVWLCNRHHRDAPRRVEAALSRR